jgi:hypothetical protein
MTDQKPPTNSHWQRQQKARDEKLKQIADAVEDGSLVIRPMTPEERKANPPKPPRARRPYGGRR